MNIREQTVDKTFLSLDLARERGFIHRDYLAHCLRWSHVLKRLTERKRYDSAKIIDIGCGRELPLARTLYSSRIIPECYLGVDYGPIDEDVINGLTSTDKFPLITQEKTDILTVEMEDDYRFSHAVMFEVAEHVEPAHLAKMLWHIKTKLLEQGATFWLSTPCWNRTDTAANHVNEMTYEFLGSLFEALGYQIKFIWGTFASIRDYDKFILPGLRPAFDTLRHYYDTNVLSLLFAPLFPEHSRNCLWEITPIEGTKRYSLFKELQHHFFKNLPGSTSEIRWREFLDHMKKTHNI